MAPADRRIYALRDSTGTVPSLPLIASSIMSKKLAEGIDGLVLDVKTGSGAFMKNEADARALAETMVGIGASHGAKVVATLTGMDQPLGVEVGNANEIAESLDVLEGGGPADIVDLTYSLAADMLLLAGVDTDRSAALERLERAVSSGAAMEKFQEVIVAQDGNPAVAEDRSLLPTAPERFELLAADDGVITKCDARDIGVAGVFLGAGRERKEDEVDPGVSISIHAKIGTAVTQGQPLATVLYRDQQRMDKALPLLERAWEIGVAATEPKLVIGRID
jgi:pyrimidine-nucleoside phosphorylase